MKIAITGALGHIGSRLICDLPARIPGLELKLIDNLSTQRYCSLFNLPKTAAYHFDEQDILKADLKSSFKGSDLVIHLAAITNAADSFANKDLVEEVNFEGSQRVTEACVANGIPLLFPSTTSVYGTQAEKVDEDCSEEELKPQSPYAESKIKAEKMLQDLSVKKGFPCVICRFGTIFGTSPGMRFHTAINKFCWQAIMGQPVTVWKTALHQHRPYLDLVDAVSFVEFVIKKKLYDGKVYNVLTANKTVNEILDVIRRRVPGLQVQMVETPIMNQLSYFVMNERIQKLGFKFSGSLEKGIDETLDLLQAR